MKFSEKHSINHVYGSGELISLPLKLKTKKAVINVEDVKGQNDCLKWAILSGLHYKEADRRQTSRRSQYLQFKDNYNWSGLNYPSSVKDVSTFQKNNPNIYVTLFIWEKDRVMKLQAAEIPSNVNGIKGKFINLLAVPVGGTNKWHYVAITSLRRLLNSENGYSYVYCERCIQKFRMSEQKKFEDHQRVCYGRLVKSVKMPKKGSQQKFVSYSKTEKLPYAAYADIECYLQEVNEYNVEHIPYAFGIYFCCCVQSTRKPLSNEYQVFVGENCIEEGLEYLTQLSCKVYEWNKVNTHISYNLSKNEEESFQAATCCPQCSRDFDDKILKVRDHCHLTGAYRGPLCSKCNSGRRFSRKVLPVFLHNFQRYDSHLIVKGFGKVKEKKDSIWQRISVLPKTPEQYLAVSVTLQVDEYLPEGNEGTLENPHWKFVYFQLQFKDSLLFLTASLDKLVKSVESSELICSRDYLVSVGLSIDENLHLIQKKGVFPYDWFDGVDKLNEVTLPPIEAFYDKLNKEECSLQSYKRAEEVWLKFECKTFKDYVLTYLRLDVYQLVDVFEAFRNFAMHDGSLDPAHYYTMPSFSLDSALKMCNVAIDLFSDYEMHAFVTSGIRGGLTYVNKHYAEKSENVELFVVDANNLYGKALIMKLPYQDYQWIKDPKQLELIHNDLTSMDLDGERGMLLEVDLDYPAEIQDLTEDFPFAAEHAVPTFECFNSYMQNLWIEHHQGESYDGYKKLLLSHCNKEHYVLHGKLLQFYLKHGMVLKRIHRVLTFYQANIFKEFIEYNSLQRKNATDDFKKSLYKLQNNSLFGKSIEDKSRRIDIRLITNKEELLKLSYRPEYLGHKIFSKNLVAVSLAVKECLLNTPIAVGQSVLDLSKLVMYQWRYEKFPWLEKELSCKFEVLGGDTDSLFMTVKGVSLYDTLIPRMITENMLDTSNYDVSHPLYSQSNQASLECLKDEGEGYAFQAFVLLKPKSYCMSFVDAQRQPKKRSKGVQRSVVAKNISFKRFYNVWDKMQADVILSQSRFRSNKHTITTTTFNKVSLSIWEDKRIWLDCNSSLPYGNHKLNISTQPDRVTKVLHHVINEQSEIEDCDDDENDFVKSKCKNQVSNQDQDEDCYITSVPQTANSFIDDANAPYFVPGKEFSKRRRITKFFDLEATCNSRDDEDDDENY